MKFIKNLMLILRPQHSYRKWTKFETKIWLFAIGYEMNKQTEVVIIITY